MGRKNTNNLDMALCGWIQKNLDYKLNFECTDMNLSDGLLGIKNALEVLDKCNFANSQSNTIHENLCSR